MKKKISIYGLLCLIFALSCAACGSTGGALSKSAATTEFAAENGDTGAGFESYTTDDYAGDYEEPYEEAAAYDEAAAEESREVADISADDTQAVPSGSDVSLSEDKIIYSGSLSIETQEYEDTVGSLEKLLKSYHAVIESRNESNSSYDWYSDSYAGNRTVYYTVRVPSDRFEEFLNAVGDVGHVTQKSSTAENITRQYQNVSVEIEALQKEEKRLLDMMDAATTIEEMIQVESRLTEVQTRLNQYLSERNSYDTDIKYSSVNITVTEVSKYTKVEEVGFGTRLIEAFQGSWENIVSFVQNLIIGLIYAIPVLIVLGLLLFAVFKVIKKIRAKSKQKKEQKAKEIKESEVKK